MTHHRPGRIIIPAHQHDQLRAGGTITTLTPNRPPGGRGDAIRATSRTGPRTSRGPATTSTAFIVAVHRVTLGDIDTATAATIGYRRLAELQIHWIRTHERDPLWDEGFRAGRLGDDDAAMRWATTWAHRTAHAVTLTHDPRAKARLLARRSEHGYTAVPALALPHEPEALPAPRHRKPHRPRR